MFKFYRNRFGDIQKANLQKICFLGKKKVKKLNNLSKLNVHYSQKLRDQKNFRNFFVTCNLAKNGRVK